MFLLGTERGAAADIDGHYTVLGVRPGTYSVRVSLIGYGTTVVENVRVQIDQTTDLDVALAEEAFEGEEIVVRAERPLVELDRTSSQASISAEELAALPVQSFQDVVNLQAGVVDGHFRGGRTGEVSYLVDGVPVNDVYDQSFAFQVENQAIQEVQVISGTFNAEYGQAQSGVVNIVTRDGGDRYAASPQPLRWRLRHDANRPLPGSERVLASGERRGQRQRQRPRPWPGGPADVLRLGPRRSQRRLPLRPPCGAADLRADQ